jgi:hypothetical protein
MKDEVSSAPTHFESCSPFTALLTPTALTGALTTKSEVTDWEEMLGEVVIKISLKWLKEAPAMFLESITIWSQTFEWIKIY